jgi:hypothetical protein
MTVGGPRVGLLDVVRGEQDRHAVLLLHLVHAPQTLSRHK